MRSRTEMKRKHDVGGVHAPRVFGSCNIRQIVISSHVFLREVDWRATVADRETSGRVMREMRDGNIRMIICAEDGSE